MSLLPLVDGLLAEQESLEATTPRRLRILRSFRFAAAAPKPPEERAAAQEVVAAEPSAPPSAPASEAKPRGSAGAGAAAAAAGHVCPRCQRSFALKKTLGMHARVCSGS